MVLLHFIPDGDLHGLRQSADIAVLVAETSQSCDSSYANSIASGQTLAVVARHCLVGYYGLGHAIANMFGAYPNRETLLINVVHPTAYGFLMNPPLKSGCRTIMA